MSERLSLPTQSWRPPRRQSLLDPQIRRMALIACGAAAVLGLGVAGAAYLANRPHGIPVIEADSRPLRVKPDNPGGMQVAGAEEQIMGGTGGTNGGKADVMAPAAEAPAPQMLRAQIQAARQPAPTPAPPAVAPVPPVQPVALASPPATPPRAAAVTPPAGGTEVQLAALETEQGAMEEWHRLSKRLPDLLAARRPAVTRTERGGKTFYRLRTGGFTDIAQATAFTQVKAKGGGCSIASF